MNSTWNLIRAFVLLQSQLAKRGDMRQFKLRSVKKLAIYNVLKRNRLRLKTILAAPNKERRWWVRPIFLHRESYGAWFTLVPTMREYDRDAYFNFLRMTPESFDWLLERVSPIITKNSIRKSISAAERLCVTLRYLASGDTQISLSYLFLIADSTISRIVLECTAAIWYAIKDEVMEPLSEEFWRRKAAEFEVMWNFPMCVGAIDGKHCFVQKFPMRGSEHYNYKFGNSVVLFAIADAKYKFVVVDVGARGRESDGGVFDRSEFGRMLYDDQLELPPAAFNEYVQSLLPYAFVGDAAFPLHTHLMTPFESKHGFQIEESVFNYRLSRARRVVENAFGILSARFRILRTKIIASETLVQNIILATTALHNLHLQREDSIPPRQRIYMPPGYGDVLLSNGKIKFGRWRNENKVQEGSIFHKLVQQEWQRGEECESEYEVREKFMELFIANPLPWQYDDLL